MSIRVVNVILASIVVILGVWKWTKLRGKLPGNQRIFYWSGILYAAAIVYVDIDLAHDNIGVDFGRQAAFMLPNVWALMALAIPDPASGWMSRTKTPPE